MASFPAFALPNSCDPSADVIPQLCNPVLHLQMGQFGVFIEIGNEELSHRVS